MKRIRNDSVYLFILLFIYSYAVAENRYILAVDEWDRPHDVNSVSKIKPLPELIEKWSSLDNQTIEIRYPGGELGLLLANRLRDWLVVLGIPSNAIITTPGSAVVTQIELLIQ